MASAKTRGKVIEGIRQNLRGGIVADFVAPLLVSGQSVTLDVSVYESKITTPTSAGRVTCLLPNPVSGFPELSLGQRHLVTYDVESANGDGIRINAADGGAIVIEAQIASGVTNYTRAAITNVDLLSGNDQALFEYAGLSGTSTGMWNLIYLRGAGASAA
jgi:hypothetical protein